MSEDRVDLKKEADKAVEPPQLQVPTSIVPLPSRGLVYPQESPLHLCEKLEIRSMTAKDEDILTSPALLKQGKALTYLLRSCILNKGLDPDDMLVGDRNAVLVAIRITGYGPEYTVNVTCPECDGEKKDHVFNLSTLPIKPLKTEPVNNGANEFEFDLPVLKQKVKFRLFTGRQEQELATYLERTKKLKTSDVDPVITTRLKFQIISIGDETDGGKLSHIIDNLPALDSRNLRKHIAELSPDVDMQQGFDCPHCGEHSEVEVPLGTEFFWPST
jgi:rRNA maturation protein Nop10